MNTTKTKIVNKHGRTNRPQCKYYSYRIITYSDYAKTEILNEKYYFTQKQITEELGISPSSIINKTNNIIIMYENGVCELCKGTDNVWFGFCYIPCWECNSKRCNSVFNLGQNTHPPRHQ